MEISEESALGQFKVFTDYYEIDEPGESDKDAARAFAANKRIITKAVMKGRLEITLGASGNLLVEQTTTTGAKITWGEYSGRVLAETDKVKGEINKLHALAGALTSLGVNGIQRLTGKDSSTAHSLASLFLLV